MMDSATQLHQPEHQVPLQNIETDNLEVDDPVENDSVPPTQYDITSYGADYPIDSLVSRIERGDIFIPPFQRSYVWKLEQASRFIESLLMGLPVPSIVLAREMDTNKLIVIDGQQRLKTLQFFYEGNFQPLGKPFTLENVAEQFSGKTYEGLSPGDRRMLDNAILPATIVRQEYPQENGLQQSSIYHIFERLNTGGTQLVPQEIRACVYHGEFNQLLDELNKTPYWQKIFQGKDDVSEPLPLKRMKDQELILRFLSLYFSFEDYSGSMKDFLSQFMKDNRKLSIYSECDMRGVFLPTIDLVYQSIGLRAFRPRRGLNAAVFDAVMVGVANRVQTGDVANKKSVKQVYDELLTNQEFLDFSINSRQISNHINVKGRVNMAIKAFREVA